MKRNVLILLSLLFVSCIAIGAVSAVDYMDVSDSEDISGLEDGYDMRDSYLLPEGKVNFDEFKHLLMSGGLSDSVLIIVDGVPTKAGMHELNSNDIEDITILKGASATAIYGSRGANGVILITTVNHDIGNNTNTNTNTNTNDTDNNGTNDNGTDVPCDVDSNSGVDEGDDQFRDISMEHTALPVVAILLALISLPLVYRRR